MLTISKFRMKITNTNEGYVCHGGDLGGSRVAGLGFRGYSGWLLHHRRELRVRASKRALWHGSIGIGICDLVEV